MRSREVYFVLVRWEPLEYDCILVVFSSVECVLDWVWVSILRFKQEGSWFLPHVTVQSRAVLIEVIQGPRLRTAALASSWNQGLHDWVYGTTWVILFQPMGKGNLGQVALSLRRLCEHWIHFLCCLLVQTELHGHNSLWSQTRLRNTSKNWKFSYEKEDGENRFWGEYFWHRLWAPWGGGRGW